MADQTQSGWPLAAYKAMLKRQQDLVTRAMERAQPAAPWLTNRRQQMVQRAISVTETKKAMADAYSEHLATLHHVFKQSNASQSSSSQSLPSGSKSSRSRTGSVGD